MIAETMWSTRTRRAVHDPPRVLVADDDPDMLSLLVDILGKDGYEVQAAQDGGRLLVQLANGAKCNYRDVDLILSDIRMPVCSGIQIVEMLRATHSNVPVILMTGLGDSRVKSRADALGAVLLMKPFSLEELRSTVVGLLAGDPRLAMV